MVWFSFSHNSLETLGKRERERKNIEWMNWINKGMIEIKINKNEIIPKRFNQSRNQWKHKCKKELVIEKIAIGRIDT